MVGVFVLFLIAQSDALAISTDGNPLIVDELWLDEVSLKIRSGDVLTGVGTQRDFIEPGQAEKNFDIRSFYARIDLTEENCGASSAYYRDQIESIGKSVDFRAREDMWWEVESCLGDMEFAAACHTVVGEHYGEAYSTPRTETYIIVSLSPGLQWSCKAEQ